jgi:hypothetical protein
MIAFPTAKRFKLRKDGDGDNPNNKGANKKPDASNKKIFKINASSSGRPSNNIMFIRRLV